MLGKSDRNSKFFKNDPTLDNQKALIRGFQIGVIFKILQRSSRHFEFECSKKSQDFFFLFRRDLEGTYISRMAT